MPPDTTQSKDQANAAIAKLVAEIKEERSHPERKHELHAYAVHLIAMHDDLGMNYKEIATALAKLPFDDLKKVTRHKVATYFGLMGRKKKRRATSANV